MKKWLSLLVSLLLVLNLGAALTENTLLTTEEIEDLVFEVCPVDRILCSHRKVKISLDGTVTVTFHTDYGDYMYQVDRSTGEILDREEADIEAARAQEGFREPLTNDEVHDIVSGLCPIEMTQASKINVRRSDEGIWEFTLDSVYGQFYYSIDGYTGEVLDSIEPDMEEARSQEGFQEPLTSETALELAEKESGLKFDQVTSRKVLKKADGSYVVTLGSAAGDYIYRLDGLTGEILERTEP